MKISVITPTINQGKFIERTVQSVITQEFVAMEFVVMDGGSTDNTIEVLQKYENSLTWVSEKDLGQAHALNKGIMRTSGDIIAWLNSDDIYYPGTLKRVQDFFAANPLVDVVYGNAYQIDVNDKVIDSYPTKPWSSERIKVECFLSQPAAFFRRRAIDKYGFIDENLHFCMDYEFWLRLSLAGAKFAYLPEVLSGARIHPAAKSSSHYLPAHFEAINMLQKRLGYIPSEWIVNYSTAKAKIESKRTFPSVRFILESWLNLWGTAGFYNRGFSRLSVWVQAQVMMMRKFVRKKVLVV